jgi:uncharacterized MnhB-related membrane protein
LEELMTEDPGTQVDRQPPIEADPEVVEPEPMCTWTARKMRPVVLVSVLGVFAAFMLLAHFVVHSSDAVVALATAAVGAVVPLVPAVLARSEYRLTREGLDRRPVTRDVPKPFTRRFDADGLSHVVATSHGFKFYLPVNTTRPVRAFWRRHLCDAYSGEVHVEAADRERVLGALARLGVSIR